jgi:serine/threonine protein kinase
MLSATLGLDFIHSRRLLHGDVKPPNLPIDGFFHAKMSGLGTAHAADGTTQTLVPVTMAYTAPGGAGRRRSRILLAGAPPALRPDGATPVRSGDGTRSA